MHVIGHRGAAGLELENTLASLKKAKELDVTGIEFDIRLTKDRQFVLCHDPDLLKVSNLRTFVEDLTLSEIKKLKLKNGETILTLAEALKIVGSSWAIIEVKSENCVDELLTVLDQFPKAKFTITTFFHELGYEIEQRRPEVEVFLAEHFKPLDVINFVRSAKADGLVLNAGLLNPLTYWLAKRRGFKIMVYTVNSRFIGWFINKLYPDVYICTDFPNRFVKNK